MSEPSEDLKQIRQTLLGQYVLFTLASCGVGYIAYRTIQKNILITKKVEEPQTDLTSITSITTLSSMTSITSETTTVSFDEIPTPPDSPLLGPEIISDRIMLQPPMKHTHSMETGVTKKRSMKQYLKQTHFQQQGLSAPRLLPMSPKPYTKILEIPPVMQETHSTDMCIVRPKPIKVQLKHIRKHLQKGISHPRLFPSSASRSVDPYTPPKHHMYYNRGRELSPVTPDMTPPPYGTATAYAENSQLKLGSFLDNSSYRETVIFLLALAAFRVYPKEQFIICNTFKFGTKRRSYFCRFESGLELDDHAITKIENEMLKLSSMQLELQSKFVDYETCLRMLKDTNQKLSAKLVQSLNRPCYRMVGVDIDAWDESDDDLCFNIDDDDSDASADEIDSSYYILQYRSTLSNTKYCSRFKLHASDDDKSHFVVRFPHNEDNMDINELKSRVIPSSQKQQPRAIRELYKHGVEMSKYLDIKSVADINGAIHKGQFKELMLLSEAYHNRQMVKISNMIKRRRRTGQLKMILISGPSSSGKTTFASKLSIYLHLALGMRPTVLEVDMWYRDRSDPVHPRDAQGNLNFETIEALKLAEFNVALNRLLNGESIRVPKFDFKVGKRTGYHKEKLKLDEENGVIIMEGIFCLNPALLQDVKQKEDISFKIFICPISPFYALDNFHFISEQVMRLLRRISRDHFHRGCKADHVVFKWGQLTEGEDINIFPFVKHADAVFNSALLYEISVLKVYSYPLLQTVVTTSKSYKDAQNLIAFLDMFSSMPDRSVPGDSLLMEFIGKSIFDDM